MKIYVIDDEVSITNLLKKYLSSKGYEVSAFNSPEEFLAAFKKEKTGIDIVITDINLPGISGIEILKIIKKENSAIIVVMITGYSTVEKAVESLKLGAFDFLEKPFNISAIERVLNNAAKIHKISVELTEYKALNKKLKELDLLKDEFIANTTHELKTPLFAISGAAEIIKDYFGTLSGEDKYELLKIIEINADRLKALINQILLIGKIEGNCLTLVKGRYSTSRLIDKALESTRLLGEKKGIIFPEDYRDRELFVSCDEEKIAQVLINLLSNAVKFSPGKSRVTISVQENGDGAVFEVADQGIGIAEDKKPGIFQKFFQADGSSTRNQSGTGIGLYLSKKIVDASGGRIWFESSPGKGSAFYFSLPITRESIISPPLEKGEGGF